MILRLTRGRHAMTTLAIIHDAGVIKSRANESAGVMADPAILTGDDMPCGLAQGKYTVVTRLTVVDDTVVIKGRRQEACGDMTPTAIRIGRHVIARLAQGSVTVMT